MKIIIKTKNLELDNSTKSFIEKRLDGIKRMVKGFYKGKPGKKDVVEGFVEIKKETNHHKKGNIFLTELVIFLRGKKLAAECRSDDLKKAFIATRDELKKEISKYKTKIIYFPRRKAKKEKNNNI